jgi:hypothetical protein
VKVDCASCHHIALLTRDALLKVGLSRGAKVLGLKGRLRCRGCGAKGRAVVSIKWRAQGTGAARDLRLHWRAFSEFLHVANVCGSRDRMQLRPSKAGPRQVFLAVTGGMAPWPKPEAGINAATSR